MTEFQWNVSEISMIRTISVCRVYPQSVFYYFLVTIIWKAKSWDEGYRYHEHKNTELKSDYDFDPHWNEDMLHPHRWSKWRSHVRSSKLQEYSDKDMFLYVLQQSTYFEKIVFTLEFEYCQRKINLTHLNLLKYDR